MASYSWSSSGTSVTGDISSFASVTGMTWATKAEPETPEEIRKRKKKEVKSIIGDDKYLLQELLTELRKEKLEQLKENA